MTPHLFQSLSGFPMSCNSRSPGCRRRSTTFQSLSGFPMSCNVSVAMSNHLSVLVSIPIGFSNELQLEERLRRERRLEVSIPIGFSNELQRNISLSRECQTWFQSLSGFPMSCNDLAPAPRRRPDLLQPYRVSNELQRGDAERYHVPCSILWFSNELQQTGSRCGGLQFQSLSGFPMSCNSSAA